MDPTPCDIKNFPSKIAQDIFNTLMFKYASESFKAINDPDIKAAGLETYLEELENLYAAGEIKFQVEENETKVLWWDHEKGEYS